jgi:Sec-independent protein translocase protein TatA
MVFLRDFGLAELIIILVFIVLLYKPRWISKAGGELGRGIRKVRTYLNSRTNTGDKEAGEPGRPENPGGNPPPPPE